jgi:hypothetical protein
MKKSLLFIAIFFMTICGPSVMAQAFTFATGQLTYNESFDAMGSAGTTFLPGWTAVRWSGTGVVGAVLPLVVTDGSGNSGAVYNVGTTGAEERAMGTLGSGSTVPRFGASFLNNTGSSIVKIDLSGTMEQWRSGSTNTVTEIVAFEYSLDATDLMTGTWIPVTSLDLVEINTATTVAAALDGNLPENQAAISASIPGLTWFAGSNLWIRWSDVNDLGSDGVYAIDNLTVTASTGAVVIDPEPTNYPTVFTAAGSSLTIGLSWVDATGTQVPAGYLVKASSADNISAPVDGTPVPEDIDLTDGAGAKNVAQGMQSCTFINLLPGTDYFFKIYPYTNSGTAIDFKNDGTAPSATARTQNLIIHQTFDDGLAPWTKYSVTGDSSWVIDLTHGVGGTPCAKMSGYAAGASFVNEDWLISPAINYTGTINQKLAFETAMKFGAGANTLLVLASSDYTSGDPSTNGTWTDLTSQATLSPGEFVWTYSGNVDISGQTGTAVHVAFKYTSTDVGTDARTWEVDEVLVTGSPEVGINENNKVGHNLSVFPNPGNGLVKVKLPAQGSYNIDIYTQIGKLIYSTTMSGTSGQLDLSNLPKGLYIINATNKLTRELNSNRLVIN